MTREPLGRRVGRKPENKFVMFVGMRYAHLVKKKGGGDET